MDLLLACGVVSASTLVGGLLDVGQLLVELDKSLADSNFGSLADGLLDDTAGGVSKRVVQEVMLRVSDLPLEVVDLCGKERLVCRSCSDHEKQAHVDVNMVDLEDV